MFPHISLPHPPKGLIELTGSPWLPHISRHINNYSDSMVYGVIAMTLNLRNKILILSLLLTILVLGTSSRISDLKAKADLRSAINTQIKPASNSTLQTLNFRLADHKS